MNQDLQGFLKIQRLAYQAVVEIGALLQEGWTEEKAADLIGQYLRDHGVSAFFHEPFAWFGNRTRFDGIRRKRYADFNPTQRRLTAEDVVILDVAPILDGYIGDIGYTLSLKKNQELSRAKKFLLDLRDLIPKLFMEKNTTGQKIWKQVEDKITEAGYDNIHKIYPFHVLGHRVRRVPFSNLALKTPARFSLHSFFSILSHGLFPELLGPTHHGGLTGYWAIEPHIGGKNFGAKFEEILVVEKEKAYWLDDEVPHVK